VQVAEKEGSRGRERCPLCHAPLGAADLPTIATCDGCGTRAHIACTRELHGGRCATHGCERKLVRPQAARPAPVALRSGLVAAAVAFAALMGLVGAGVWVNRELRRRELERIAQLESERDSLLPPTVQPLPHVRAGQRWRYELLSGGTKMEMIYTVVAVEPQTVRCRIQTLMDMGRGMQPVGDPQTFDYPRAVDASAQRLAVVERVSVDGVTLMVGKVTSGDATTYLALAPNGTPVFPGWVRSEGATTARLIQIEQP
jgi:hypothetical protein